MKKRVLSLFLTFVLSFSMMPMSVFAEEAGTVTEQEAQSGEDTVDVFATGEDISGGNAVTGNAAVQEAQNGEHTHPICGANCSHETTHNNVWWTPLTYNDETQELMYGSKVVPSSVKGVLDLDNNKMVYYTVYQLPAGNYYLADNITLTGGEVTYNGTTVTSTGGILGIGTDADVAVRLCLNGKTLSTLTPYGVIDVGEKGALTLSDCVGNGQITSDSKAENGVQISGSLSGNDENPPVFTMYGGKITGTQCGVFVMSGIFNMYGGTITGNTKGVDAPYNTSKMTVGGTVKITDNFLNNVYLGGTIITIDASLTDNAEIGVTTGRTPTAETSVRIATGVSDSLNYTEIFKPDAIIGKGCVVVKNGTDLYLSAHKHNWTYTKSADGKTLTASCAAGNCDGGSVTIKAPVEAELIYDGNKKAATLEGTFTNGESNPQISYKDKDNTPLNIAPVNAGSYTASITMGSETASVTYEIKKATPDAGNFTFAALSDFIYDGNAKTVTVKEKDGMGGMGGITVKYNGSTQAPTNAGSYEVTFDVADGMNYNAGTDFKVGTLNILKAAAPQLEDIKENRKYMLTGVKTVDLAGLVAGATGYTLSAVTGNTDIISESSVDANGVLKYTLTGKGGIGDTVTLPVTITSVNYEDTTVKVVITLTEKDDQAALSITGDNTVVYGKTMTLGTTGGSGTGKVTYSIVDGSTGEATIDADGVLTPTKVGTVTVKATKAGDADYNEATSAAFVITITKASPTGEPKYTVITTEGKTLADAGLTLTGSTLNPAEGTLKWVDEAGNELPADTRVEVNKTYKWLFIPANTNYDILTGEMVLYPVYQILDGANSSWTQNTDGSIKIRGNGAISKFENVKVDGVIVDPANYTVTEGSTIVEFKPEYLKTLSEGSHTFEMFWKDGSASTNFTIVKNTADDDDDDNGGTNTAGSSDTAVQTLTKSPKTGDASGLWITLFMASAAGLAVMLVRRKKY